MRVIATAKGYDNVTTREPGDEFEMPDGAKGTWFEPVEGEAKAKPKKGKAADSGRAETVSELAKEQADLA